MKAWIRDYLALSRDEKEEIAKNWLEKYQGQWVLVVLLFILSVIGVNVYNHYQQHQATEAAIAYQTLVQKEDLVDDDFKQLIANHQHTAYASIAAMQLADRYIEKEDYQAALDTLSANSHQLHHPVLRSLFNIRMAMLAYQLGQYPQAEDYLAAVNNPAFETLVLFIRSQIEYHHPSDQPLETKQALRAALNKLATDANDYRTMKKLLTVELNQT